MNAAWHYGEAQRLLRKQASDLPSGRLTYVGADPTVVAAAQAHAILAVAAAIAEHKGSVDADFDLWEVVTS